jgi:hypothetical protein
MFRKAGSEAFKIDNPHQTFGLYSIHPCEARMAAGLITTCSSKVQQPDRLLPIAGNRHHQARNDLHLNCGPARRRPEHLARLVVGRPAAALVIAGNLPAETARCIVTGG